MSEQGMSEQDIDNNAQTLKPNPLPVSEQLTHLEESTANPVILRARRTIAININHHCEIIIPHAKDKANLEKIAQEAKSHYRALQTTPGAHTNELRGARETFEANVKQAGIKLEHIVQLIMHAKQRRSREWEQLQMIEAQAMADEQENEYFSKHHLQHLELQRSLQALIAKIRQHLQTLTTLKIDIDQT
ncbi:MAG: hypothetical protein A2V81_01860 [Candidatus Abawacabacteria bacterium RBG_16_42_10]|uniref:Uncharacterized protein n=1 Tax=Candidatus Abawacabacteria bacterium RBG_16_42_10 TaxID=1817814 RepID=A0A1F4XKM2_9BACT|nr:MAG: hypothetical protein A2V81_01860 [Candidatus Abawacabacteria bacterium RBG_16_42_10]